MTLPPPASAFAALHLGAYEVLGELGRGGMGVVYRAHDRQRNTQVALKTLQRLDASALYRLKQEFRTLAEVAHPNLVVLHELVATGEQGYIAMELLEGMDFLRHVRGEPSANAALSTEVLPGTGPEPAAAEVHTRTWSTSPALTDVAQERLRAAFLQLASGVATLHAHGILHRDLKPSNVMVTPEGRVVLLDFGLAAATDVAGQHQDTDQHIMGTVAYMAPEQAAGLPQSSASDWYSVGVMLHEALTGQLPFTGTPMQILLDKQKQDPPPPRRLVPGVPEDLDSLCQALLRRAPSGRPTTQEVLRALKGHATTPVGAPAQAASGAKPAFVGRDQHMAELADAYAALNHGRPVVVRLAGRSGTGKSMLAQQFLDGLQHRGAAAILAGKCYERESVPFKTLDSVVDALSRYLTRLPLTEAQALLPREVGLLARVFPVLQRVAVVANAPGRPAESYDPHDLRRRAFKALRELLARLGDRKPLVLFIDDLQWGDLDGAKQLAELLRPPDPPVLLLVTGHRSEDAATSPCLGLLDKELAKAGAAVELRQLAVEPLTADETRTLVATLLGPAVAVPQEDVAALARESRGNPFFVQVLVRSLTGEPASSASDSARELSLDQVLWTQIQALPEPARRLLEAVAVSGQPLPLAVAHQVADCPTDQRATLSQLRGGRFIRGAGARESEEIETYHDRIRETLLAHLPQATTTRIHRRIAEVLEAQAPAAPALDAKWRFDLAYHFDAGGASDRALPYALSLAAEARAQYALEKAEQLYRIAERGAAAGTNEQKYQVAQKLGDVLMLRGTYSQAAERFQAALHLATEPMAQAKMEAKLGELEFKRGEMQAAVVIHERALRLLGQPVPRTAVGRFLALGREVAIQTLHSLMPRWFVGRRQVRCVEDDLLVSRLYHRLSYPYWFESGTYPCLWAHLRAMNLAERYTPTQDLALLYSGHAPVMSMIPWVSRGVAYAEKATAIFQSLGDLWGQGQTKSFHGMVLYAGTLFSEALENLRDGAQLLERTGDYWEVNIARTMQANTQYRLGDLRGALAEAQRVYHAGLELGDAQAAGICLDVWTLASGGQVPEDILQTELDRSRTDLQATGQVKLAEGVQRLMQGNAPQAIAALEGGLRLLRDAGIENALTTPLRPWLATAHRRHAETCSALERPERVRQARLAAKAALKTARRFKPDLPHALRECGLLAALEGKPAAAKRYLEESQREAERQQARFEIARSLLAYSRVGDELRWPGAGAAGQQAATLFQELGAQLPEPGVLL